MSVGIIVLEDNLTIGGQGLRILLWGLYPKKITTDISKDLATRILLYLFFYSSVVYNIKKETTWKQT